MSYQRKTLSTGASIGAPGPLPGALVGLAPETLANLPAAFLDQTLKELGFRDTGFVWVDDPPPPPPPPVRTITALDFMKRMPLAKRAAIMQAADAPDYVLKAFLTMVQSAVHGIDLDDPDTQSAVAYLQSKNLLAASEAAALLA